MGWFRKEPERTAGQIAYEADVQARPLYFDGKPRRAWDQLDEPVRWSWERNPTPRNWYTP